VSLAQPQDSNLELLSHRAEPQHLVAAHRVWAKYLYDTQ